MHILMLNYEFPPLGGGAGNAAYYLLRELAAGFPLWKRSYVAKGYGFLRRSGYEGRADGAGIKGDFKITLVTSSTGGYREEQFAPNIKIYYLDIGKKGNLHFQSSKDLLSYSWAAYRFCKWYINYCKNNKSVIPASEPESRNENEELDSRLAPSRAAGSAFVATSAKEAIAFGDARLKLRATRGRGNDRKKDKNALFGKVDLVHAFFGIPCGYIAMRLKLPYIVSLRGTDVPFYNERFHLLDKYVFSRLSGRIWRKAAKVVANSEGLKQLAQKSHFRQEIEIIPNGVDIDIFKPAECKNKPFTILSTSRLIKRKGIGYLVDAFVDFNRKYPDSHLILAGSGNLEAELREKADLAGISKNVNFLGVVSKANIPHIYRQSDVFALPSLAEGMSNSVLEAMASGLAILATDVGGTAELIGNNGFIIEKGNSRAIFDALERIYKDRELLAIMKQASRQKAEEMSWAKMAGKYIQIYQELCAE